MCDRTFQTNKRIGVWISDKKSQKLNWKELIKSCKTHGYTLIKMDLDRPLEEQEPIDVFLHKLTDILAAADQGDQKARNIISHVEQYLSNHPNITVIDPLDNVRILLNRYHICKRPSLKNFYPSEDLDPIFYSTGEVCKADSQSTLSILDPHDQSDCKTKLNEEKIRHIIRVLQTEIGLLLAGFDVVIDNVTGDHAVIDINVYPSYDNFPNFFEHLLDCIDSTVNRRNGDGNIHEVSNVYDDFVRNHRPNGLINVGMPLNKCDVIGMNIN
ncbi:hypothetical protein JYU34_013600 [Plutella xylostella]|uniref:Inositol-tetrakisphosphate 1-kinase n=1 Tax=Plutella xylostella TaxID=51655 RepID=A0ABQ7QBH6_PLUXY|nr:hypothetical protein JYU34_013600 [Plutella xylostella]